MPCHATTHHEEQGPCARHLVKNTRALRSPPSDRPISQLRYRGPCRRVSGHHLWWTPAVAGVVTLYGAWVVVWGRNALIDDQTSSVSATR